MTRKTEWGCQGQVRVQNGEKVIDLHAPVESQGHMFRLDVVSVNGRAPQQGNSYRIVFVLSSGFLLYRSDLRNINHEEGHSNLKLGSTVQGVKSEGATVDYRIGAASSDKQATLLFEGEGDTIQKCVVEISEGTVQSAVKIADRLVNQMLDVLSFLKKVPLKVRHVDVFDSDSQDFLCRYTTIPFTAERSVERKDLELMNSVPDRLIPLLRLYREAIGSPSPHHRFLCLYRMGERLKEEQRRNSCIVKKRERPERRGIHLPDNELTRKRCPKLIGRNLNKFLGFVRDRYRKNIAHLNFDESDRVLLPFGEIGVCHDIDGVNAMLEDLMRDALLAELEFMDRHRLE